MSRYKYVFFDMDGTIGNTQEGIFNCTRYAFKELGVSLDDSYDSLRRVIGPPLVWAYQEYFGLSEDDAVKATELYRQRYESKGMYEMSLYDGVEQILKKLTEDGFVLAVVSAKPQDYIDSIMKHFKIDKYFSYNCSASKKDIANTKTHLIKKAIEHFGIKDLSQVVMVGDRIYDLDGAKEAEIDGIGVLYGFGDEEEIMSCRSVYVAKTPYDIYDFLTSEGTNEKHS